jgi:integrin beta 3
MANERLMAPDPTAEFYDALGTTIALAVQAATAPLVARLAALEARAGDATKALDLAGHLADLARKVDDVASRAPVPGPPGPPGERGQDGAPGAPGTPGRDGVDGRPGEPGQAGERGQAGAPGPPGEPGQAGPAGTPGRDGRDGVAGAPGLPGDKGLDGAPGRDGAPGQDGKDGKDGLALEDLAVVFDEAQGTVIQLSNGVVTKSAPLGSPLDFGLWSAGRRYPKGAGVTHDGSWWIAQDVAPANVQPGLSTPASRVWRLAVKRGRNGKDGKDGRDGGSE